LAGDQSRAEEVADHTERAARHAGTIAFGLLVYGAFIFAITRYRRIDPA